MDSKNTLQPPPYQGQPPNNTTATAPNPAVPAPAAPVNKHIFPPAFGFYHTHGSDLSIALSASDRPLFQISHHTGWSSKPTLILHNPAQSAPAPLATADFHPFSSTIDLCSPAFGIQTPFSKGGAFTASHSFTLPVPPSSQSGPNPAQIETFEWKNSSGAEVSGLMGGHRGMKCVRASTGEVVAAWAPPSHGRNKKGKMAFLPAGGSVDARDVLGAPWEVMCVISALAMMERRRRQQASGAAGGGAGA